MEEDIEGDLGVVPGVGDGHVNEADVSVLRTVKVLDDCRSSWRKQVQDNWGHDHLWLGWHGQVSVKPDKNQ